MSVFDCILTFIGGCFVGGSIAILVIGFLTVGGD